MKIFPYKVYVSVKKVSFGRVFKANLVCNLVFWMVSSGWTVAPRVLVVRTIRVEPRGH